MIAGDVEKVGRDIVNSINQRSTAVRICASDTSYFGLGIGNTGHSS